MEELLEVFNDLYEKYKILKSSSKLLNQQNNDLTKKNDALVNEGEKLLFENESLNLKNTELNMDVKHMSHKITNLEKDIKTLKDKSNDLYNTVVKFTKRKQHLYLLLSSQRSLMYKQSIGYSSFKEKPYKNGFIRETTHEKVDRDRFGKSRFRPSKIWVLKALLSSNVGT